VTSGPAAGKSFTLEREVVIGREGVDLTIDDPELSRRHAALRPVDGGIEVEDLGSTNGTFVAGRRIDGPTTLTSNGTISLGTTEISVELAIPQAPVPDPDVTAPRERPRAPVPDPDVTAPRKRPDRPAEPAGKAPGDEPAGARKTLLKVLTGTAPGTLIPVGVQAFVIGRGEPGLGMLDQDPELSREHARVSKVDGRIVVEDLGSANGTFVNGNRIAAPTVLKPGDSLYVGTTTLQLVDVAFEEGSGVSRAASSALSRVRAAETTLLEKLAAVAHRRPKRMLGATAVFFVIAAVVGGPVAGLLATHPYPDPNVESSKATKALEAASGKELGVSMQVLVRSGDVNSAAGRAKVDRVISTIKAEPLVAQVFDFYNTHDQALVSRDRKSTYVGVQFKNVALERIDPASDELETKLEKLPGVLVGGGGRVGPAVGEQVGKDIGKAEGLAFPILLIASIFLFRGLVAALLPLFVGALTVFTTFLALRLVNDLVIPISVFALNMVIALGLGLAIDYSLFIVSRYREELRRGASGATAIRRTLKTAGRTVIFSALTVAAALGSLLVFPQKFVYSMGIGGALCSLIAMTIALVALPPLIVALGPRINAGAPKRWREAIEGTAPEESGFWYRLSQLVMRRRVLFALGSSVLLLALGSAFLGIKFTGIDATVLPASAAPRKVDQAIKTEFAVDRGRQINLAVKAPASARTQVQSYANDLRQFPDVSAVSPPQPLRNSLWEIDVVPRAANLDDRTIKLVKEIRRQSAPFPVQVAGSTAEFVDQQKSLSSHLPLGLSLVAIITVIILFALTGSVVLPLKSLVMNVLTVSAAFGVLVLIFQHGRLEGLLGYKSQGGIEATQPLLLFALSFGLSTDYGVFLLTRIKEARDSGMSERDAVAAGLERTGKIVTAAAILFCIAIGAFATSSIIFVKEIGVGTAFAVLVDATIVRALLVPSLMAMLGARNWWAPGPLRRLHERFGISEG
jgi:RND superfamily putative drug exporter